MKHAISLFDHSGVMLRALERGRIQMLGDRH